MKEEGWIIWIERKTHKISSWFCTEHCHQQISWKIQHLLSYWNNWLICDKDSGCIWTVIVHKILGILLNVTVYMGKKLKRLAQIWKHLYETYIHYA